jgi:hypothetical protein
VIVLVAVLVPGKSVGDEDEDEDEDGGRRL